jgi:hypothetical protein
MTDELKKGLDWCSQDHVEIHSLHSPGETEEDNEKQQLFDADQGLYF